MMLAIRRSLALVKAYLFNHVASSNKNASVSATTNEETLATILVPANVLGANGRVEILTAWTMTNSANNKTCNIRVGQAAGDALTGQRMARPVFSSSVNAGFWTRFGNKNATNSQEGFNSPTSLTGIGNATTAVEIASVDTTKPWYIFINGQKASSGETLTLNSYSVKLYPNSAVY